VASSAGGTLVETPSETVANPRISIA